MPLDPTWWKLQLAKSTGTGATSLLCLKRNHQLNRNHPNLNLLPNHLREPSLHRATTHQLPSYLLHEPDHELELSFVNPITLEGEMWQELINMLFMLLLMLCNHAFTPELCIMITCTGDLPRGMIVIKTSQNV